MESIVRLSSLKISNIKNVKTGQIVMPNTYQKHLTYKTAEVLGLYRSEERRVGKECRL